MKNEFVDLMLTLLTVCAFTLVAFLLSNSKQKLRQLISELVQKMEDDVQGSGMGAVKKERVIAQLRTMGVHVTQWVEDTIDAIVAELNKSKAWLKTEVSSNDESK